MVLDMENIKVMKGISMVLLLLLVLPLAFSQMTIQYDDNPEFNSPKDRIGWVVELDDVNKPYNFTCISYVMKNNELIQTNPKYVKKNNNFINFIFPIIEEGTYFPTENGLANVYFTTENLKIDGIQNFTFGVQCKYGTETLTEERIVIPTYKNIDVAPRLIWGMDNSGNIIGLMFLVFVVLILTFWIWKKGKE